MTERTRPVVLVTGGSGMIGRSLARALHTHYTVVGLDVDEPSGDVPYDSVHYMDVTSGMSVRYALRRIRESYGTDLAAVVHLAAYYDFGGDDSPLYEKITIDGTARVLRMLEDFEIGRFIFTSTMLVHAPVEPGERIREDSPIEPRWPYPKSKVETEEVIRDHRPAVPYTFLRIAGVYTGFGKQPTLIHQIGRIEEQDFKSFFFPGDSEAGQSMVHIEDAVDAIVRTVDRRGDVEDGPILIGEPDPPSYSELQDTIGLLLWGEQWPTIRVPGSVARAAAWLEEKASNDAFIKPYMIKLADDHYALDITRARETLGWEPEHRLLDELPKMIDTMKSYPVAWRRANGLVQPGLVEPEPVGS